MRNLLQEIKRQKKEHQAENLKEKENEKVQIYFLKHSDKWHHLMFEEITVFIINSVSFLNS